MATLPSPDPPAPGNHIPAQNFLSQKTPQAVVMDQNHPTFPTPSLLSLHSYFIFAEKLGFPLSFLVHPRLALRVLSTSKWPNQLVFFVWFFFLLVFKQTKIVLSTLRLSIPTLSKAMIKLKKF